MTMKISWNPSVSINRILPATPQAPQLEKNPIVQCRLVEVPEEAKHFFKNQVGQRIQSDYERFTLQKAMRKKTFRTPEALEQWANELFKDVEEENSKHSNEEFPTLAFFGDHLSQGEINDCFLIAVLYAALKNPQIGKLGLAAMINQVQVEIPSYQGQREIASDSQSAYEVIFPGYPDYPLTVNPVEFSIANQVKGGIGFRILEYAFAQLSQMLCLSHARDNQHLDPVLSSLHGGGYDSIAMYALTGNEVVKLLSAPDQEPIFVLEEELKGLLSQYHKNPAHYLLLASTGGEEGDRRPKFRASCK